jgi:hypothetical protein
MSLKVESLLVFVSLGFGQPVLLKVSGSAYGRFELVWQIVSDGNRLSGLT